MKKIIYWFKNLFKKQSKQVEKIVIIKEYDDPFQELNELIVKVDKHFNCDISQNTRQREIVMARGAFFWLARNTTFYSLAKIGKSVKRDHSSVVYALKHFQSWIDQDVVFKSNFESLKKNILSGFEEKFMTNDELLYQYNSLKIENDILKKELIKLKK